MSDLRTLPEALAAAAGSAEGYTFVAGGAGSLGTGDTRRTYAEMYDRARSAARALRAAGLGRGDLVALVISDAEQFLTTLFGACIARVVPASLYPPATMGDLAGFLDQTAAVLRRAGARAVVASPALMPGLETLRASCPDLQIILSSEGLDAPGADEDDRPSLDDIAFVQFTSGSTSIPKGVALSHRNLAANVEAINGPSGLGSSDGDSAVSWLPLNHDMGLVGMALGPLYCARPAVFLTPQAFVKRPAEWLKAISRYRATVSFAPNFAYDLVVRRVKDRDLDGLDLSLWRVAGCGAEPIHAPTLKAFAERFAGVGFRASSFLPCYGLAEHVLAATFPPRDREPRVDRIASPDLTEHGLAVPSAGEDSVELVSCGHALPDHAIRIVGEDGETLGEREIGEIRLSGPSVMLGYYRDDALSADTIKDGWLRTGDLGYLADDELFVCGRLKDIIIANGRKYHPQDVEWALAEMSGIRRGRVVAFGTSVSGAADRVVIVAEPSGTVPAGELTDAIRRRISDVLGLYVDEVVTVSSGTIGRTTSGKVQRAATKARYERGALLDDAPVST